MSIVVTIINGIGAIIVVSISVCILYLLIYGLLAYVGLFSKQKYDGYTRTYIDTERYALSKCLWLIVLVISILYVFAIVI